MGVPLGGEDWFINCFQAWFGPVTESQAGTLKAVCRKSATECLGYVNFFISE